MKRRIQKKIINRFLRLDEMLSQMFYRGGLREYREEIDTVRTVIRYWKRRYPHLYRRAFGMDHVGETDLGHWGAGR